MLVVFNVMLGKIRITLFYSIWSYKTFERFRNFLFYLVSVVLDIKFFIIKLLTEPSDSALMIQTQHSDS